VGSGGEATKKIESELWHCRAMPEVGGYGVLLKGKQGITLKGVGGGCRGGGGGELVALTERGNGKDESALLNGTWGSES